jgi:transposase
MANYRAREIVEEAEVEGLTHQKIAEICNVSLGTVSRWKTVGRARSNVIALLEAQLKGEIGIRRKYLDEANLEDLAERARQLGFRVSFTDIKQ